MLRKCAFGLALAVSSVFGSRPLFADAFITLNVPGAVQGSRAYGIDGGNVIGYSTDSSFENHGFLYDGSTYTPLDVPGADSTQTTGIHGQTVVGYFNSGFDSHGFTYNTTTHAYSSVNNPGNPNNTVLTGTDGNHSVGYYDDSSFNAHSFIFDNSISTFTSITDIAGSVGGVIAQGIDGTDVVGYYSDSSFNEHGFLYDTSTAGYTTIDDPSGTSTFIYGINGNKIVGEYMDAASHDHGFVYDDVAHTFTTVDYPGSNHTILTGIDDDGTLVGYERTGDSKFTAFEVVPGSAAVPLPSACWSALALFPLVAIGRRKGWQKATA